MNDKLYLDWEDALVAVRRNGGWRFFADKETMFILDYSAYDDEYTPLPGEFRYGILVVDTDNASQWMNALRREFNAEQLPLLYRKNTETRVQLTFVVDFDKQLWVGCGWKMDQSPLDEYQPVGWTAIEDNVYDYVPDDISSIWR